VLTVQTANLSELHQDPDNARAHNAKNLEAIVGSLRAFGQVEPLVVNARNQRIVGGNGRFEAMQALGWTSVQVTYVDLDDLHARALALALNRSAELAEWDTMRLERAIGNLQQDNFALDEIGFSDEDVARILRDSPSDQGAAETDNKPITSQYLVLVSCTSEAHQVEVLDELVQKGYDCKALVS
jgi:ParB-like chromosome segregation protein Spo0J